MRQKRSAAILGAATPRSGRPTWRAFGGLVLLGTLYAITLADRSIAAPATPASRLELPYAAAGLTEREAAAHLLDRFAFGARPGEVDRVLEIGLASWIERQLSGDLAEPELARRLAPYDALRMSAEEIAATFPRPGVALRRARTGSEPDSESGNEEALEESAEPGDAEAGDMAERPRTASSATDAEREERRRRREAYESLREQGYRSQRELVRQLQEQKVLRAVHSENQLHEVLADFWFNHFNVSTTDNQARGYVLSYERDAIRPHVTGSFRELLGATARHPAMLQYLDNAQSRAQDGRRVAFDVARGRQGARGFDGARSRRPAGAGPEGPARAGAGARPIGVESGDRVAAAFAANRPRGLNENYARELLELHTLGVDGGYTQQDVIEVARAFTGWSVLPPRELRSQDSARISGGIERLGSRAGFVTDAGGFLFHPAWHDAEKKNVLGISLPSGRGIADGEQVLDLVAAHPSTARHVAHKLATRFVSDEPPAALVDRLAQAFGTKGGDIQAMLRILVESKEFWSARGEKVKSPFELAVSAVRATGADVATPAALVTWISRMGQPLFQYQAPTGYPDRADFWVNTGALLNRMNFGLQLAAGRVRGVAVDVEGLLGDNGHPSDTETPGAEQALRLYAPVLMPERELDPALARLVAMASEPELVSRVEEEAAAALPAAAGDMAATEGDGAEAWAPSDSSDSSELSDSDSSSGQLAQVLGVLLGSPEFQQH